MINKKNSKRGISTVVVTVLLILISIIAVALVWNFVGPYIRQNLDKYGSCFNVGDKVKIASDLGFTCAIKKLNDQGMSSLVTIKFGDVEINEMDVVFYSAFGSKAYRIKDGGTYNNIQTFGISGDMINTIEFPKSNEARTYIFYRLGPRDESNVLLYGPDTKVEVYPVVNGKPCDYHDTAELTLSKKDTDCYPWWNDLDDNWACKSYSECLSGGQNLSANAAGEPCVSCCNPNACNPAKNLTDINCYCTATCPYCNRTDRWYALSLPIPAPTGTCGLRQLAYPPYSNYCSKPCDFDENNIASGCW